MGKDKLREDPEDLKTNLVDFSVAGARGVLNLVPIIGPVFAEVIGTIIPNQKIDRLRKYAVELERRIEGLEYRPFDGQFSDEKSTDLLEEGFRHAAHSITDERRGYIASLVARGLKSEEIDIAASRHLLRILDEINDIEVIWLRYYGESLSFGEVSEFAKTHEAVLTPVLAYMNDSLEERIKQTLQDSYKEHLAQLGLLDREFERDLQTDEPVFDGWSGAMKVSHYRISGLGRLLLREIGLDEVE